MKIKTTILIALLLPFASQAGMRMPKIGDHDCGQRSNAMGSQVNGFEGILHKAGLVGEESGRVVSADPNSLEAQIAETNGTGKFCGKATGALNLIEHNGRKYLVGNAHGFYKNGKLRCNDKQGLIYPDIHYPEGTPNIDRRRSYAFKAPPLNHASALKDKIAKTDLRKLNDLVILEVEDESLFLRQNGDVRKTIKLAPIESSNLKDASDAENMFMISARRNFQNKRNFSFQENCSVNDYKPGSEFSPLKKHNCDTGNGSSGSSLNFLGSNEEVFSIGIHYGGRDTTEVEFQDKTSREGNFFIPSSHVIKVIDDLQKSDDKLSQTNTVKSDNS